MALPHPCFSELSSCSSLWRLRTLCHFAVLFLTQSLHRHTDQKAAWPSIYPDSKANWLLSHANDSRIDLPMLTEQMNEISCVLLAKVSCLRDMAHIGRRMAGARRLRQKEQCCHDSSLVCLCIQRMPNWLPGGLQPEIIHCPSAYMKPIWESIQSASAMTTRFCQTKPGMLASHWRRKPRSQASAID